MRLASLARRRIAIALLGLLGIVLLIAGSAIGIVAVIGIKPAVERYVTWKLDRRLAIGSLRIGWGDPLSVDSRDLRLANAPWGSTPEMVRIASLSARIEWRSLFRGVLRFDTLEVAKPEIVLERNPSGVGNWRLNRTESVADYLGTAPKKRTGFPTLIDFHLRDGGVTYRTSSGALLRIDLHDLRIGAAGDDTPASLVVDGAYNDTPVRLTAETQSFAVLRNGSVPFGAKVSAVAPPAGIDFQGTMMAPLDFDGVQGAMQIDARDLGGLLNIFGAGVQADFPASLAGTFTRSGDQWRLADAKGNLAGSTVAGTLTLAEGGRGKPDDVGIDAGFAELALDPLLGAGGKDKAGAKPADDYGAMSLQVDAQRGTNFDVHVAAKQLDYRGVRLTDVATQARLVSGEIAVDRLAFAFAGGTVDASGSAQSADKGGHVVASAAMAGADSSRIVALLGGGAGQVAGKIDGRADLDMTGATLRDALGASRGHAVLTMSDGRIARALLEKLSTDLRALFRTNESSARISCLIGVVDLKDGLGTLSPLRLQTPGTTIIGGGQIDLPDGRLDLTVKSEAASTGIFALDIPLHISGGFSHLSVVPAVGSSAGWLDAPGKSAPAHGLPPEMQQLADSHPCPR